MKVCDACIGNDMVRFEQEIFTTCLVARKVSKGHSRRQQAQHASAMSCRDTDFQAGDPSEVVCLYVGWLRTWVGPGSCSLGQMQCNVACFQIHSCFVRLYY